MYFSIKDRELSIMEKGITLHEAEDLTSWLDDSEIVNFPEPGLSHCTAGLVVGCTHGLLGEWKECPSPVQYAQCRADSWEMGPPPRVLGAANEILN